MDDVRVRLQCAGLRAEYTGSRAGFESLLAPLLGPFTLDRRGPASQGARRPPAAEAEFSGTDGAGAPDYEPPLDRFGTFQRQLEVGDGNHAGLVAAYAFFLWNYEKREVFSEDEIAGCFVAHGLEMPADAVEVYGDLLSQRVLSPGAARNTWRLTSKGRDFVRHHLLSA